MTIGVFGLLLSPLTKRLIQNSSSAQISMTNLFKYNLWLQQDH